MNRAMLHRWHGDLLSGQARAVRVLPTELAKLDDLPPPLLFPGAFNPLHAGHRAMAQVAEDRLSRPVEFEISLLNVDKPPLGVADAVRRCEQFTPAQAVWLTGAPRFTEKADIFPGATFIVGIDTVARLVDPRYYDNDATACQRAIGCIAARGCRFLVFGRTTASGFQSLSELALPPALAAICEEVSEREFRHDVSSTGLRIAAGAEVEMSKGRRVER